MKKKLIYLVLCSNLLLSCSVSDWLTIQPQDTLAKEEMFASKQGFYDALYGVYTTSRTNYNHNGHLMSNFIEYLASQWEVQSGTPQEDMKYHEYGTLDAQIATIFTNEYKTIANINLMLSYLETQTFLTKAEYEQIKAECLALRAWLHFDLIRMWGPIPGKINMSKKYLPYVTELTYDRNNALYYGPYIEKLQNDMNEAESLFANYPEFTSFRLGKWGVLALQARINFWLGNKDLANQYAMTILNYSQNEGKDQFQLGKLDNIGAKDYRFTKEHLFGIHVDFTTKPFTNTLYNTTAYLDQLFEYNASDIRVELWKDRTQVGLQEPAKNPLKYSEGEGSVSIVRLSEIYFIAMETGTLEQANELYQLFTTVRGLSFTQMTSMDQVKEILLNEYRKEFISEGVLFYYYKYKSLTRMPRNSHICTDDCYVLPLPKKEINVNG